MGKKWWQKGLSDVTKAFLIAGPGAAYLASGYRTLQAEKVYKKFSGHYNRQSDRISEEQTRAEIYEAQQEKEREKREYYQQRKQQVDERREKVGVGTKYRTSTRNSYLGGSQTLG